MTETAPAESPAVLRQLANEALAVLARSGSRRLEAERAGVKLSLSLKGPDIPASVPATYAPPRLVQDTTTWIGSYTLRVRAPLTTLEVAWNENEPLRIMAFSRGDWEAALTALAQGPD